MIQGGKCNGNKILGHKYIKSHLKLNVTSKMSIFTFTVTLTHWPSAPLRTSVLPPRFRLGGGYCYIIWIVCFGLYFSAAKNVVVM